MNLRDGPSQARRTSNDVGVPRQVQKVAQTQLGGRGNCFEACVATLTGQPVAAVPVYTESNADLRPYLARLDQWLAGLGLRVVALNRADCPPDDRVPDYIGPGTFWILDWKSATPTTTTLW